MGWDNKCFHCGSDKHTRKECGEFERMMKKANPGISDITKMKPPQGYKSALAKARDAQKAADLKKKTVHSVRDASEDTASEDDEDTFSQCGTFHLKALRPVKNGTPWIKAQVAPAIAGKMFAFNKFDGIDQPQEFDHESLKALNQFAHKPFEE